MIALAIAYFIGAEVTLAHQVWEMDRLGVEPTPGPMLYVFASAVIWPAMLVGRLAERLAPPPGGGAVRGAR